MKRTLGWIFSAPRWIFLISSILIIALLCCLPIAYLLLKYVSLAILVIMCILMLLYIKYEGENKDSRAFMQEHSDVIRRLMTDFADDITSDSDNEYVYVSRNDDTKAETIQELQWKLMALQAQINPHFLYNVLDSIRTDALVSGAKDIADMTETLARMFRYSINQCASCVTIEDELQNAQHYLQLQQYRFGNRFTVEQCITGSESLKKYIMPRMLVQPLIENAIVHGLEDKQKGGLLTIKVEETENRVIFRISDNGTGIVGDKLKEINALLANPDIDAGNNATMNAGLGVALKNVNKRTKLFFDNDCGLHIYSMEGVGTTSELVIKKYRSLGDRIVAAHNIEESQPL